MPCKHLWESGHFCLWVRLATVAALVCCVPASLRADGAAPEVVDVEGQPLGANVLRLIKTLDFLGAPLNADLVEQLRDAASKRDSERLQSLLDPHVLAVVSLNPEVRVKAVRGPAEAQLQQHGFTPHLIKVLNASTVTRQLRIHSPQSGPVYSGPALGILKRQAQTELKENENVTGDTNRFLSVEVFRAPPMTPNLSGLEAEYAIILVYSKEAGKREATLSFDVGGGTQDIGFRGETPVLFDIRAAVATPLSILDADGKPTAARLEIRDALGRIHPPQAKRLAPDFFFQPQIYRQDGDRVLLPPGRYQVEFSRGPEYRVRRAAFSVDDKKVRPWNLRLQRWIDPSKFGYFSGDHHIHGAGCSHYDNPTQCVRPEDMFLQVKGEGLNVGCVLTWGPCFEFQRDYFSPIAHEISEPRTVLKYDLEISGFGSAALGHVCLLNLKDQTYPGSKGGKTEGWPTWTLPVMRWCKEQGGVTGYPHSAMHVNPDAASKRMLARFDEDGDSRLTREELGDALLPKSFADMDEQGDGTLTAREIRQAMDAAADEIPNYVVPEMNGAGAMEIFITAAEGACDFISAMDTARIPEWNTWYHLLNCGLPVKLSGETDFPCMSSRRVGQGRVYVRLGDVEQIDFPTWCKGLAAGRSYVSDGFAHAIEFQVAGRRAGEGDVLLDQGGQVQVEADVAFSPETPMAVAYGFLSPPQGRRMVGDTINLHAPRNQRWVRGGKRLVELVVNGEVVDRVEVPADGALHKLQFQVPIAQSSWVTLRQFPQLHTNPVNVLVADKPIRASRRSALWCVEAIDLLWKNRSRFISESERDAAREAYSRSKARYREIARQAGQ